MSLRLWGNFINLKVRIAVRKKNVAIVYHFFPHYRKGILEALIQSKDLDVQFYGGADGIEGIKEYPFPENSKFKAISTYHAGNVVVQPYVIFLSLFGRFDSFVFLANPYFLTTWIAAAICRLRGRRVVFWGHGFKSDSRSLINIVRRSFFSLAQAFYTYGWRAKENAIKLGFEPESIYVGFNSLDYNRQLAVRRDILAKRSKLTSDDSPCIKILCISRLTDLCRYDMLFDAINIAAVKYGVNASVVVIGDGPSRKQLESQVLELGLKVDFIGALYDEGEIARHVFDADVTVSPGKVGLTAMHSLMYGTPVISNDDFIAQMPEVEAIVKGKTGLLFKSGDVQDLAACLRDFSSAFQDRDETRENCFRMIDEIYNPSRQLDVLVRAVDGIPAEKGDDAFVMFRLSA